MISEQRKACPACGEQILTNAKKCRFCGEWLQSSEKEDKTKKKALSVVELFWLWFTTIFLFYGILIAVNFNFENANVLWVATLGLVIAVGMIIFALLAMKLVGILFNKEKRRQYFKYLVASPLIFILFFVALYQVPSAYDVESLPSNSNSELKSSQTPSALATPSATPRATYQPPNNAAEITPTNATGNTNKPVHCPISSNCGGGTKPLTSTECDNSVCCQIGDKWILYLDKNKCEQDQSSEAGTYLPTSNDKKVQYTTRQAMVDGTFYCYESKVNELSRYEQMIEVADVSASICTDGAAYEGKVCGNNCPFEIEGTCIDKCYDDAYSKCTSKNEEVGNMRKELHSMIGKYCP